MDLARPQALGLRLVLHGRGAGRASARGGPPAGPARLRHGRRGRRGARRAPSVAAAVTPTVAVAIAAPVVAAAALARAARRQRGRDERLVTARLELEPLGLGPGALGGRTATMLMPSRWPSISARNTWPTAAPSGRIALSRVPRGSRAPAARQVQEPSSRAGQLDVDPAGHRWSTLARGRGSDPQPGRRWHQPRPLSGGPRRPARRGRSPPRPEGSLRRRRPA